jgi:hypothetical protein
MCIDSPANQEPILAFSQKCGIKKSGRYGPLSFGAMRRPVPGHFFRV